MRTLAIGDVHGASSALDRLLEIVKPVPGDQLIFLGDYVDRGPDSRGVLDRLLKLRENGSAIFLRGNHELMMLRSRTDRAEMKMWLSVGGAQTLSSYGPSSGQAGTLRDIPVEHWQFLEEGLLNWYETSTHLFVHAGLNPDFPLTQQTEETLFWAFLEQGIAHPSGKVVICGHTSQRSGVPLDFGDTVCIDTFVYGGGWLTCLDVSTYEYWQADVIGRVREGMLPAR